MRVTIDVDLAIQRLDMIRLDVQQKKSTRFWTQCVRDANGKWSKYDGHSSLLGVKYFRGHQPAVNYKNSDEITYLHTSIETRHRFYIGLSAVENMKLNEFREWLEELRRTLEYRPVKDWLHQILSTTAHTLIVREEVMPIARVYSDPYVTAATRGPVFFQFPDQALPYDEVEEGGLINHNYPPLKYGNLYFKSALKELKELLYSSLNRKEYIYKVGCFYQLLINLHYFDAMNASLYMNMANGLLEIADMEGIENGIVDFSALRLQPDTFQKYFYDEVIA